MEQNNNPLGDLVVPLNPPQARNRRYAEVVAEQRRNLKPILLFNKRKIQEAIFISAYITLAYYIPDWTGNPREVQYQACPSGKKILESVNLFGWAINGSFIFMLSIFQFVVWNRSRRGRL